MVPCYTEPFQVRSYDVDAWGDIPASMLAAYLEQAARAASADRGFDDAWYAAQGTAWVIRRLTLARFGSLRYRDSFTVQTWISSLQKVRSSRDYELCGPTGDILAAGRADWVYFDRVRMVPKGIDRTLSALLQHGNPTSWLAPPPPADPLPAPARVFASTRRAYRYEADSMAHINNTVYLAWLDEALAAALANAGLPLAAPGAPALHLRGTYYAVDYLRSALPGDALEIHSHLAGTCDGGQVQAWAQEIVRPADGEVLLRAASRQQVCDPPAALDPPALLRALTG